MGQVFVAPAGGPELKPQPCVIKLDDVACICIPITVEVERVDSQASLVR